MELAVHHVLFLKAIGVIYILMSVMAFCLYGVDKRAAIKQKQRISERTLHLTSFFGGWLGALLAQKVYRHKTQKQPFRFIFWLTILANILLVFAIMRSELVIEVMSGVINELLVRIQKMI